MNTIINITGAGPGIFVRGVKLSENFDKQKKKEERKRKVVVVQYFPTAEVWFKLTIQTIIYIQVYFSVGHGLLYNCKPLST